MKCRRRTVTALAAAAAATVALAARPTPARADGITANNPGTAYYLLTVNNAIPAIPLPAGQTAPPQNPTVAPQVVALIAPPGAVVPPLAADGKTQEPPMTVLNSFKSTDGNTYTSSGLDPNSVVVGLNSSSTAANAPDDLLGLWFYGQGLKSAASSGQLVFSLSVDKSLQPSALEQLLKPETPGVTIKELASLPPVTTPPPVVTPPVTTPTTTDGSGGGSGVASIPEPMSLALWSAAGAAGLLRARAARRRKAA